MAEQTRMPHQAASAAALLPHLNPIERLWGVMHKAITHNRWSRSLAAFQAEILTFLRRTVPQNWATYCDKITDNFRVQKPSQFRIIKVNGVKKTFVRGVGGLTKLRAQTNKSSLVLSSKKERFFYFSS
ncbi:hypothetical protein [Endosaccharibacter trunci]|uniref:hypothetical protein n=1 Tax=Endosaccharibacter trunci TaxID=2812733 RepID=UPI003BF574B0